MELLNPPRTFPPDHSFYSFKLLLPNSRSKFHAFFISRNPTRSPLLPSSRNLRVSAHFGRPPRRRNSLRKKLSGDDQQVSQLTSISAPSSSDSQNPPLNLENSKESLALDEEQGTDYVTVENVVRNELKPKVDKFGISVPLSRLKNWVDQHKHDSAYWGVGSSPIFTVFHDIDGKVRRVSVDENEILERSKIASNELKSSAQVQSKISYAKELAMDMERGRIVSQKNSSVAKFVALGGESSFRSTIQDVVAHPRFFPILSRVGKLVLFSLVAAWALKRLLHSENKEVKHSALEKEMMRRKMKWRKEKEALEGSGMEVVDEGLEKVQILAVERPKLDKQQLMKNIYESNVGKGRLTAPEASRSQTMKSVEFDPRIQQIRAMARKARKIEREEQSMDEKIEKGNQNLDIESFQSQDSTSSELRMRESLDDLGAGKDDSLHIEPIDWSKSMQDVSDNWQGMVNGDDMESTLGTNNESSLSSQSIAPKPKLIRSVQEAREFLSNRRSKNVQDSQAASLSMSHDNMPIGKRSQLPDMHIKASALSTSFSNDDASGNDMVGRQAEEVANWVEENSNEVEPIFKMIGDGFRDSFKVARETANQNTNTSLDLLKLEYKDDDGELYWMKDDALRDIVFRVRENELSGRDPFYMMEPEDKHNFFEGLKKKVERENEKLLKVHVYLHANIENLDYGADGISLYDQAEKIIPRWKGPPMEKNLEFLEDVIQKQRDTVLNGEDDRSYHFVNGKELDKFSESRLAKNIKPSSANHVLRKHINEKDPKASRIVIEGSDGSTRPGQKSGKEFWQHTKKWSRGFLECYNAEPDPETKSVMKDIGKDLDRWITEEEIQEAADMMTKLPERNKEFLEKKINKLKREMELFGPQAVVSKYREYAEEKEEDFLWWLDLPHVLCIELYTIENGEQKTGFYSLEMGVDLELDPKPCHVIAFEDAHDCKNLCYIIQAHLEMLGNGHAFVVPRPPKDTFREAKANGFSVTVIRKGQLQLNIDQPLEEVEEEISEIGSKIYHDKLMQDRGVDMNSLMKGVFGLSSQTTKGLRKRAKRKSKKETEKRAQC
ncbi:unnamed protein product [Linum trigynum]|uniref:Embryo defective 1703 n=1 Tax=Linum trigynum TaxID=586398 RepID=A0AAV2FKP2_9ROSI